MPCTRGCPTPSGPRLGTWTSVSRRASCQPRGGQWVLGRGPVCAQAEEREVAPGCPGQALGEGSAQGLGPAG